MAECLIDGCERAVRARGRCMAHYQQWRRANPDQIKQPRGLACAIDDCPSPVRARGWCARHYELWRAHGDPRGRPRPLLVDEALRPLTTEGVPITAAELAWAAGFLDGEGHFGVSEGVLIEASQVRRRAPLDELARILGGRVTNSRRSKGGQVYRWALGGSERVARAVLLLAPYLRVKDAEAKVLLDLAQWFPTEGRRPAVDPLVREMRGALTERLLNERHQWQT